MELGLSFEAVAERSGVSTRSVQRLENGEREGHLSTWFRLAGAVDLHLDALVSYLYEVDAPSIAD
jgi:transcriptional regulator with XRE-family HTH domain